MTNPEAIALAYLDAVSKRDLDRCATVGAFLCSERFAGFWTRGTPAIASSR